MAYQNYDDYMASTGQQSTLDQQRRDFSYDRARSAWEARNNSPYGQAYNQQYDALKKEIESYIGELEKQTQGDYDFIAKWIENNYTEAVGNNEGERAQIIKEVANDLEKRVGRIGFDHETGKYRIEQDKSIALERLKKDEVEMRDKLTTQRMLDREQQNTSLNSRGLMEGGSRGTVDGLAAEDIGRLEKEYTDKFAALERAVGENTQDINLSASRNLEDLFTGTRRGFEDATQQKQYGLEDAQRTLERKKKELAREKTQSLLTADGIADYSATRLTGAY